MSSNSQRTGPGNPSGLSPLAEGEDGLFSQSWFPICLSDEIPAGQVKGFAFLGGRIVVMRGADGKARAMSAYCPHLGADLAVGTVVENSVRCAFHQWEYNTQGQCVRTGCGDPPPARARLFAFPTAEHFGVVFAFNGDKPLFDLPGFEYPAEQLLWRSLRFDMEFPVDPWVISCNTPDLQHIRVVHRISFDTDPANAVEWTDHSMQYEFSGRHAAGEPLQFRVGIHGTNIFQQSGLLNGRWFGFLSPMGLPRPQTTTGFLILAVLRDQSDAEEFLESVIELERRVVGEDESILKTIRFKPGTLTASDRTLSRFLRYLKEYPRAHPSRDYIT